jgi:hypothetical protein
MSSAVQAGQCIAHRRVDGTALVHFLCCDAGRYLAKREIRAFEVCPLCGQKCPVRMANPVEVKAYAMGNESHRFGPWIVREGGAR